MGLNLDAISDVEVEGINTKDYPDFCDAFIASGYITEDETTRELTDEELDWINMENSGFVHEQVMEKLY